MRKKYDGDDLFRIDQEIQSFLKSHKSKLSDEDHEELRTKLKERAKAISDVLGMKVHSVCEDDD